MTDARWYALRVVPRREMAAVECIGDQGFDVFSPLEYQWVRGRGEKRRWHYRVRAMLPGYLFAAFGDLPWRRLAAWRDVIGVVGVAGDPVAIPEAQIAALRQLDSVQVSRVSRAGAFCRLVRAGDEVTILDGAMRGRRVTVDSVTADGVRALVDLLGRDHMVSLRHGMVELA